MTDVSEAALDDEATWAGVLRSKGFFWLASRMAGVGSWSQAGATSVREAAGDWWIDDGWRGSPRG